MRVLITGGAGFVGSHLADRLLEAGSTVHVIDNYATGRRDNLTERSGLTITEGSIAEQTLVDHVFDTFKPEVVVHAAAAYKDPTDWVEDVRTNNLGTVYVVRAAERLKVRRLVYFQTSLCYGLKPIEQPISLKHPLFSGESRGGSSYAISKTAGELYIELSSLDFVSFRLANAYGPRNISGPLPTFFSRLSQGKPCFVVDTRRDFIFIDDLVAVVEKAVQGMGERGFYHISTGRDYSIKELFDETIKVMNVKLDKPVEVRDRGPDDVFTILIDPAKTERDFAWSAKTSLADGVRNAIEYYQKFGITETFTHLKQVKG